MDKKCRIGVVGAGVFGGYHANKCAKHSRIDFVGIYDPSHDACVAGAAKHNVTPFLDYAEMLAIVDAVIIACPARFHGTMALQALDAGRHCLIEKPIAASVKAGQAIVDLAKESDLIVQIGHQERLVAQAIGLPTITETPVAITAQRYGPRASRNTDVSVTLDLMTHDIDLVLYMMGRGPDAVQGRVETSFSSYADKADAVLRFGDVEARLSASRVADAPSRVMRISYPSGSVTVDFNAKSLVNDTPFALNADFDEDPLASDSLGAATDRFVSAVLDGSAVLVSAQAGLDALRIALEIDGDQNG